MTSTPFGPDIDEGRYARGLHSLTAVDGAAGQRVLDSLADMG